MKPSPEDLLIIYRKNLSRYEAEGDEAQASIERKLISRIEAEREQSKNN